MKSYPIRRKDSSCLIEKKYMREEKSSKKISFRPCATREIKDIAKEDIRVTIDRDTKNFLVTIWERRKLKEEDTKFNSTFDPIIAIQVKSIAEALKVIEEEIKD